MAMRQGWGKQPNPPTVMFYKLEEYQVRKICRLALLMVVDLALEKVYAAYEKLEFSGLDIEEKQALWSMLDSTQRSTLKGVHEDARTQI